MWHLISVYNRIGIETYSLNPINVLVCFVVLALTLKNGPDSRFSVLITTSVCEKCPDNPRQHKNRHPNKQTDRQAKFIYRWNRLGENLNIASLDFYTYLHYFIYFERRFSFHKSIKMRSNSFLNKISSLLAVGPGADIWLN